MATDRKFGSYEQKRRGNRPSGREPRGPRSIFDVKGMTDDMLGDYGRTGQKGVRSPPDKGRSGDFGKGKRRT